VPVINTNIPALAAEFNLGQTGDAIMKSIQRLSSGLRINTAAADAAVMAISQELKAEVTGTNRAVRNAQDGISTIQTAEGALNAVQSILQRMRELAADGANGDLNTTDRNAIQLELGQLTQAIDGISQNTRFNGLSLLTGSLSSTFSSGTIQIGTAEAASLSVSNVDLAGTTAGASYSLSICDTNGTATYAGGGVTQTISIRDMTTYDAQRVLYSKESRTA
jgi:flagellin